MTDEQIREAWERFHGPILELDGYIPATPPTYSRGYRDGYAAAMLEFTEQAIDAALALAKRRDALAGTHPACVECGEVDQIQLVEWIDRVTWRCRKCGLVYRDYPNEAESHAPAVIESMKNQITLLRLELRDALSIGYGASMNWPKSARELLEMDG